MAQPTATATAAAGAATFVDETNMHEGEIPTTFIKDLMHDEGMQDADTLMLPSNEETLLFHMKSIVEQNHQIEMQALKDVTSSLTALQKSVEETKVETMQTNLGMSEMNLHVADAQNMLREMEKRMARKRPMDEDKTGEPVRKKFKPNTVGTNTPNDVCYQCQQPGHWARQCPQRQKPTKGNCYRCNSGHWANECPQKQKPVKGNCYRCNEEGHWANECPQAQQPQSLPITEPVTTPTMPPPKTPTAKAPKKVKMTEKKETVPKKKTSKKNIALIM